MYRLRCPSVYGLSVYILQIRGFGSIQNFEPTRGYQCPWVIASDIARALVSYGFCRRLFGTEYRREDLVY